MSPDKPMESFEALLASIATRLLGQPVELFDVAIDDILLQLVRFLDVERSMFAVVDPIDGIFRSTHAVAIPGVAPFPVGMPGAEVSPWVDEQLTEKRVPIIVSSESDLPPEASVDLQTFRAFGVRSVALFPIVAGDHLLGAVSFGTTRRERQWPQPVVDRLRLIAEVFAGALLRREHERKLRASLAEVEALRERLQTENEYLREGTLAAEGFEDLVGESAALRNVLFQAEQVAPTDATVLLLGETGTGKELIAKAIHAKSGRRDRTLVKVNCAALPPTLIESELFGHEKGAFTGAVSRKIGRFELADRSTLFLDEIGELPLALQAKLLRVLQEGEFERVGSSVTYKADVRLIAASNSDLSASAREGTFRPDLYYRLRVFPIELPPLRARKEDIPVLVWHFLNQLGMALGRKIERVPAPTMDRLLAYDWPGNIRELRNVLERAVILSPGTTLLLEELDEGARGAGAATPAAGGVRRLGDVERDHILRALESCGWRVRGKGNAASRLGLNASTLYSRMKKLGIQRSTSAPRRGAGWRAPLGLALALLVGAAGWSALASAEDAPPPPPGPPLERLFEPLKEELATLPPFLRDTNLSTHFRIYYFNQTKPNDTQYEALAAGGWIKYQSGWLLDTFAMGASFYGSAPLYAPPDKDGTLLLKPGQKGYYVPGEAWGALRYRDYAQLTGYRQLVDQTYINPQDNRMTPNTFEGVTLGGKVAWVQYLSGYLWNIKTRNSDEFVAMSSAAGVKRHHDGVGLAGVRLTPVKDLRIDLSNQYGVNTFNTLYAEADYLHALSADWKLRLSAQITDQRAVGDALLAKADGKYWVTQTGGARIQVIYRDLTLTGAFSITGAGNTIQAPWGSFPGFLAMIDQDFDQANEKAWMIGAAYDFSKLLTQGLTANFNLAWGVDAINPSTRKTAFNQAEYDFTVDFRPTLQRPAFLQGFWFRARADILDQQNAKTLGYQFRLILNWERDLL